MPSIQEQQAEYEAFAAIRENLTVVSFTIPMAHRLWIEKNWREMGYSSRSDLGRAMIAAFIEKQQATE